MTATATASALVRAHGVTIAAEKAAHRVRRWAAWTDSSTYKPFPLHRLRFWLAVDWEIHHNKSLPALDTFDTIA